MKSLGITMVLLGAGSFVLNLLEREFTLLMWIDTWGPTAAIAIRLALVAGGAGLWFAASRQVSPTDS